MRLHILPEALKSLREAISHDDVSKFDELASPLRWGKSSWRSLNFLEVMRKESILPISQKLSRRDIYLRCRNQMILLRRTVTVMECSAFKIRPRRLLLITGRLRTDEDIDVLSPYPLRGVQHHVPPTEEHVEEFQGVGAHTNSSGNASHVSDLGKGFTLLMVVMLLIGFFLIVLGFASPLGALDFGLGAFLVIIAGYGISLKAQEIRRRMIDDQAEVTFHRDVARLLSEGASLSEIEESGMDPFRIELIQSVREIWLEPKNDAERRIARPVWRICPQCTALIIVSGSTFCSNCGASLYADTRAALRPALKREVKPALLESKQNTGMDSCMVCKMSLKSDDILVGCPHCGSLAHKTHLLEWLHVKDYCPACERHLDERELTAQIEQRFWLDKDAKNAAGLHKKRKATS